jgi:hypothetical protein
VAACHIDYASFVIEVRDHEAPSGPTRAERRITMTRRRMIAYWVTTGILAFCMTGGVFELLGARMTIENMTKLGYPAYIIPLLGLGKLLAIVAIVWPGFPRLKEWAYAGIFFNMTGATVSHIANEDGASIVIVTTAIATLTLSSWALRPPGRRLGPAVAGMPDAGVSP